MRKDDVRALTETRCGEMPEKKTRNGPMRALGALGAEARGAEDLIGRVGALPLCLPVQVPCRPRFDGP